MPYRLSLESGINMQEMDKTNLEETSKHSKVSPFVANNFSGWQLGLSVPTEVTSPYNFPIIGAVGGGKGGVGKSIVSANLAAMLAQYGFRVLVVDLDVGCSNLHSHFGVAIPKRSIADFLMNKRLGFKDIILSAPVHGVAFIAAGREDQLLNEIESSEDAIQRLWHAIYESKKSFKVDIVLLDLGAGTHDYTLNFFVGSHLGILTVLPEPTSIENAYVFLKMALMKTILNVGHNTRQEDTAQDVVHALGKMTGGNLNKGYAHYIRSMKISYPRFVHNYQQANLARYLGILVNQTRDQSDRDIGYSMEHICAKYFGLQSKYLGHLNHDEVVLKSLRNRGLLVSDFPNSLIAKRFSNAASNSLNLLGFQRRSS